MYPPRRITISKCANGIHGGDDAVQFENKIYNLEMSEENKTYSIRLRLRRVIHEDAYVSVFVNEKVMKEEEDGGYGIDTDKLAAEAIRIGSTPNVDWQIESTLIEPHPLQNVMPDGRKVIDSFYEQQESWEKNSN